MKGYGNLLQTYQMLLAGPVRVNTYIISIKIKERRGGGLPGDEVEKKTRFKFLNAQLASGISEKNLMDLTLLLGSRILNIILLIWYQP